MPSPIRGCRNISYEHNVMVSHVHRTRYRLADLVSLLAFYLPMAPLDGPCGRTTFNSSAAHATQLWLKIEFKTQDLFALLAKG